MTMALEGPKDWREGNGNLGILVST